jgi:HEAT repeat protein
MQRYKKEVMMPEQNSRNGPNPSDVQKINELIAALGDTSIDIRHEAVQALGDLGKPAVPLLITALANSPDNDHRWYAAVALSRIGGTAIDPLIDAMRVNHGKDFRRYAAAALGNMGESAVESLINAMGSDDADLRGYLSRALCRIGKPAVEPLTRRLDDADALLRTCAMGETGLPAMVQKIQDEEDKG